MNVFQRVLAGSGVLLFLFGGMTEAHGQIKLPFRQKTNESQSLNLAQSNGPWLVMVASFRGEEGKAEAKRLALELRKNRFTAYTYTKSFEREKFVQGKDYQPVKDENDQYSIRRRKMKHLRGSVIETAVMVGDFPNVEDKRAQRTLSAIKKFQPANPAEYSNQNLARWREFSRLLAKDPESKAQGPYRSAFLMINPFLPDEYFDAYQVDDFVMKLNRRVKHSLLGNPQPYSVRVATFRGHRTLDINNGEKLLRSKSQQSEDKLALAAAKAHKLTIELRKLGVDAYEFHDRSESYVCVGGFDWIKKMEGPKEIFNPEIAKVVDKFKGKMATVSSLKGAIQPKQLPSLRKTDIVFDMQPMPVKVPRFENAMAGNSRWR